MCKTKINRIMALLLALVMALAAVTSALAADAEDYTTVTGTWEYDEIPAIGRVTFTNCNDPSNPSVVVVPSVGSGTFKTKSVFISGDAIKNPNMTVISLPKEFHGAWHTNIYNCTKIVYRGTKADWSKNKPSFGDTGILPRKIPVVTLDGEVIDTIGPSWWPADSGPLATKEYLAMTALMEEYPNGSHWSSDSFYTWKGGIWNEPVGACQGFAMMVSDAAFGDLPAKPITYKQWSDIRVGDILMLYRVDHAVIVLEVYDDHVIAAGGNVGGNVGEADGRVQWGTQYDKDYIEYAITNVITRWPDRTGATVPPADPEPTEPETPETPAEPEKPTVTFTDVSADAWYYDAVNWAVSKNIANGTGNNQFSPLKTCTHNEIIVLLHRAAGNPAADANLPFTLKNAWAADALKWAYSKGVITASFNENAPCTRYDAVSYIWKAFGSPTADAAVNFNDVSGLDTRPIAWAVSKGIVNGTSPNTFSPDLICDRATIVTLLHRAYR